MTLIGPRESKLLAPGHEEDGLRPLGSESGTPRALSVICAIGVPKQGSSRETPSLLRLPNQRATTPC